MISFWREVMKEGEQKGRASEIIEMRFEFGLSENDILERLQKKLNISLQTAQEYLAISEPALYSRRCKDKTSL